MNSHFLLVVVYDEEWLFFLWCGEYTTFQRLIISNNFDKIILILYIKYDDLSRLRKWEKLF